MRHGDGERPASCGSTFQSSGLDLTVTKQLDAIVSTSLSDIAYEKISDAIVNGHFAPGERLTIRGLAEMLGTSSTPVRDAVKRLILERALEQRNSRDIRVPHMGSATYSEIARIRMELEGLAADAAARTASPAEISELERNVALNEKAIAAKNWSAATELNRGFHFKLVEMASMPILDGILKNLWLQAGPPIAAYYQHGGTALVIQHHEILEALRTGNSERARLAIVEDIHSAIDGILAMLTASELEATNAKPNTTAQSRQRG
jgi:DNA-binding GntR family transcriptional regulator